MLQRSALSRLSPERGLLLVGRVAHARGCLDDDEHTESQILRVDLTYTFVPPKTRRDVQGRASNTRPELRGSRSQIGRTPSIFAPGDPLLILYADDERHVVL